jgi:hypothetical protein
MLCTSSGTPHACGVAPASTPRTLTRATARTTHGSYPGHGIRQARLPSPASRTTQPPQTTKNQAQDLQSLDVPLHMGAQIRPMPAEKAQVSAARMPDIHDCES